MFLYAFILGLPTILIQLVAIFALRGMNERGSGGGWWGLGGNGGIAILLAKKFSPSLQNKNGLLTNCTKNELGVTLRETAECTH